MAINICVEGVVTFKELAQRAESSDDQDIINFARKVIINAGGDPNKYFKEKRGVLDPESVKQSHSINME